MFDDKVWQYLPHRPPMLLVNQLLHVDEKSSHAKVSINEQSPFFDLKKRSVPAWVGIEYMGQTAALIAGYQLEQNLTEPHLGFLLGSRNYSSSISHFKEHSELTVKCIEQAVVGDSLATFNCSILINQEKEAAANAILSVFRRPIA